MAKNRELGDCYRWAYQYLLKHPTAVLCQGTVVAPYADAGPARYAHAWIVDGGVVKDWQTMVAGFGGRFSGRGWPAKHWVQRWQPLSVKKYTITEAVAQLSEHGHYGPWEK